ncbi:PAAR-like protein, partial [Pseudomonas gingeri]|uniref:PAAR-like protein n=1 Tax=Pseudomonas gingeri TaxID=117681 RepID=UPI00182D49DD
MGSPQVCSGATLQCSFGAAPGTLNVLPINRALTSSMPAANIMDYILSPIHISEP